MIKEEVFTNEWLLKFRNQAKYKRINPAVFEKMVYALLLLDKLAESDLEFVFKGGTSLILLLDDADRFSVDIDIMTISSREEIDNVLTKIVDTSQFIRYEYDDRRGDSVSVPKAHYKIYYESKDFDNANILLDILFEENYYPQTLNIPVNCPWVSVEEPIAEVQIPCVNSILGDKLTAFAPNTTGIRYNRGKHIEIIKQLHDVGRLTDNSDDFHIIKTSFETVAVSQIKYRELDITPNDVCDDIIDTALLIARRDKNRGDDRVRIAEIQLGLNAFSNYLMYGRFTVEDAINASAKAALLAAKIKYNATEPLDLYANQDLSEFEIANQEYNFLNRFKKTLKPAFYHWWQILKIIGIE